MADLEVFHEHPQIVSGRRLALPGGAGPPPSFPEKFQHAPTISNLRFVHSRLHCDDGGSCVTYWLVFFEEQAGCEWVVDFTGT